MNGSIISSLSFKYTKMVDYNASKSNQGLLDWFKTQVITIRDNESTIILEMCQVRREGTLPLILIVFYLL
jgi:hypothetical protein